MNLHHSRITTMTSREFDQDTGKAKRAAAEGPVIITTRGEATHVLLTKEEFDRLEKAESGSTPTKEFRNLAEALADPRPEADFEFEIPEFKGVFKGYDFD